MHYNKETNHFWVILTSDVTSIKTNLVSLCCW